LINLDNGGRYCLTGPFTHSFMSFSCKRNLQTRLDAPMKVPFFPTGLCHFPIWPKSVKVNFKKPYKYVFIFRPNFTVSDGPKPTQSVSNAIVLCVRPANAQKSK
jgi:hypothetical protein